MQSIIIFNRIDVFIAGIFQLKVRFFCKLQEVLVSVNQSTSGQEPASPCIGICKLNSATNLCEGCFRTIDEIASWGQYSSREKQQVLHHIESRCERLIDSNFRS
jgi:predicted Fe-S protein YdhL (DUF1289 family)